MAEMTSLQVRANSLKTMLESREDMFKKLLPKTVDPRRFITIALLNVNRNPALLECSPSSFYLAVLNAAHLGLEPDGVRGLAYLVPFKREVQLVPGYKGFVQLSYEGGAVRSWETRGVYEGDEIDVAYGLNANIIHRPKSEPNKDTMIGAYAIARLTNGGTVWEYMTIGEINTVFAKATGKFKSNTSPWFTDFIPMAKKTVVKRTCKLVPYVGPKLPQAIGLDDEAEIGVPQTSLFGDMEIPEDAEVEPTPEEKAAILTAEKREAEKEGR
jgi:recombination protein RecT